MAGAVVGASEGVAPSGPAPAPGAAAAAPPKPAYVPALREDLHLVAGPMARDGSPTWTLHDPVTNRFFRLGWLQVELLRRWPLGEADKIALAVTAETTLVAEREDALELASFLDTHELTRRLGPDAIQRLADLKAKRKIGRAMWLLKNYLFLKVTLLRPERFLRRTLPWVAWLGARWVPWAIGALALIALHQVDRSWDRLVIDLERLASPLGVLAVGLALTVSKILHEFGHAYVATAQGVRVNGMGVAFLVMWPVLWTDATDAWRLRERRKRLAIDAAGMAVELTIAAIATIAWSLMPDGLLRFAMLVLAAVAWIGTLAVNLNPLMRFDGYYIFSDLLDEPNLNDRAFAMGRWWLRERLFGFGDPQPEIMDRGRERLFIVFAGAVWIYRFFLFLGIALLVYHVFFKALGIFLMAVEIGWFILRPVARELQHWWSRRQHMTLNHQTIRTLGLAAALLALFFWPFRHSVEAPAVLRGAEEALIVAPAAGLLAALPPGAEDPAGAVLAAGTPIAQLIAPDLMHERDQALRRQATLLAELGSIGVNSTLAERSSVLRRQVEEAAVTIAGTEARIASLQIDAPFVGRLIDVPSHLRPGDWVGKGEPLGILRRDEASLIAYVEEAGLAHVQLGRPAHFTATGTLAGRLEARVTNIASASPIAGLGEASLAVSEGGPIEVEPKGADHVLRPLKPLYEIRLKLQPDADGQPPRLDGLRIQPGTVRIEGEPESMARRTWRWIVAGFVRESGS